MEEPVTKKYLESTLETALKNQTDQILEVMQTFMFQVDDRFNKLELRMDQFDQKLDRLATTLDGFAKRVEDAEVENAARDAQVMRLIEWAKDVSKKTGVPLPAQLR